MKDQRNGNRRTLGPIMLALTTEEGAMSQRKWQVALRNWRKKGNGFRLEPAESTAALLTS